MRISVSFDDANVLDLRAASLLETYGMTGTFYYPSTPVNGQMHLSLKQMKDYLADKGHEIGGHTVNHITDMKLIEDDEKLDWEIKENKNTIEFFLTRKPITKFCYPRGRYDDRVREAVKKAGYTEARTTRVLQVMNYSGDPFQMPTTIHMYPREEYQGVHWLEVAKVYLEKAVQQDGFFSLWGHSSELERFGYWTGFEEMLKKLSTIKHGANGAKGI